VVKKQLSRHWRLEVDTGDEGTPNWAIVRGLSELSLTIDPTEVDVTDLDSDGWGDSITAARKWQITAQGYAGYTGPDDTPVDDPGQAYLRTKGVLTGEAAKVRVRLYRTDTNKGYEGVASVNWQGAGGQASGVEPFNCTLAGSGALSPYTHTPTP